MRTSTFFRLPGSAGHRIVAILGRSRQRGGRRLRLQPADLRPHRARQHLALKESLYVRAARSIGASRKRIMFVHIMPGTLSASSSTSPCASHLHHHGRQPELPGAGAQPPRPNGAPCWPKAGTTSGGRPHDHLPGVAIFLTVLFSTFSATACGGARPQAEVGLVATLRRYDSGREGSEFRVRKETGSESTFRRCWGLTRPSGLVYC